MVQCCWLMLVDSSILHVPSSILVGYMGPESTHFFRSSTILAYPCSYKSVDVLFFSVSIPFSLAYFCLAENLTYIPSKCFTTELHHWTLSSLMFIFSFCSPLLIRFDSPIFFSRTRTSEFLTFADSYCPFASIVGTLNNSWKDDLLATNAFILIYLGKI